MGGGSVVAAVPGYSTESGLLLETGQTLYAHWTAEVFLPVDALGSKNADEDQTASNGTYLILSEPGAARYMLADTDTSGNDKVTLSAETVTVNTGTVTNEAGNSWNEYILDSRVDEGKWTVTYKGPDKNKKNYPCYSFVSVNNRGLARNTDAKKPAQAWLNLASGDQPDMRWSYGLRVPYILDSYEWVGNTTAGDAIGWQNDFFMRQRSNIPATPAYLYKLQIAYIFD